MVVVDLDGTLVRGNTFRLFMRELLRLSISRRKPGVAVKLGIYSGLRIARLITHRRLKWNVLKLAAGVFNEKDLYRFARGLTHRFNPAVEGVLKNEKAVLATAAPAVYVAPLANTLGVDYVATEMPPSGRLADFIECRGTEKLKRVLKKWGPPQDVITDHVDDHILLRAAQGRRILVHPSASTLATVQLAGLNVEVWP